MIFEIESDELKVEVNTAGGELWSILDKDGTQYLWQGDATYWSGRAHNLFPYIARLTDGKYTLFGETYMLGIHGFVGNCELVASEQGVDYVNLLLKADEVTKEQYPYEFTYEILYRVQGKKLEVTYRITSLDSKTMYFAVGGHPGFNIPLESGLEFTDYLVEFSDTSMPQRVLTSEDCFVTGESEYPLNDSSKIPLEHGLFDNDAIILKNMPKEVVLRSAKGRKGVRVSYPQMQYLGLWHTPKSDAPFVCIEPWSSLPSRKGMIEDFEKQEDLIALPKGEIYTNTLTIEIV